MEEILTQVGTGLVSGLFLAGGGYFKANEKFELKKFATTILIGAGVGGVAGLLGVETSIVEGMPVYAAITVFVDYLVKGVLKRVKRL